ncbi:Uncharacterised protein [Legionella londiniensis]|nr:Uncharacterised protein [Legionella londiniensis]
MALNVYYFFVFPAQQCRTGKTNNPNQMVTVLVPVKAGLDYN